MDLTISLSDELARYVKDKVQSGGFESSSAVVAEALRVLEAQDVNKKHDVRMLGELWAEGMERGDFAPLDIEAVKNEGRKKRTADA